MATNSRNDRLISDLPLHTFTKLVSHRRAIADAATLRQQILSKLKTNAADDGSSITTVRQLVKISPPTLLRILDPYLTYVECNRFLSRVHRECAVRPLSALAMMRRTRTGFNEQPSTSTPSHNVIGKIPTGLPTLDQYLQGGLPIGSIAELVGRAGVGKTHLAQQLCVVAAKLNGGTVYIDAEKKLSLHRLREIAFERFISDQRNVVGRQQRQRHAHELAQQVLENVSVHQLLTTRELLDILDQLEDEIILRNSQAAADRQRENATNASSSTGKLPVRLIVIDSIAAPLRRDFDMLGSSSNTAAHRASAIFQIAKKLKQLAYEYQLAVVVVNQVGSGSISSNNSNDFHFQQRNNTLDISDGEFKALLGTAWQYCVTTRIVLEHEDDPHRLQQEQHDGGSSVRMVTLAKSLVSKRAKLPFELTKLGLCEVSPT